MCQIKMISNNNNDNNNRSEQNSITFVKSFLYKQNRDTLASVKANSEL